MKKHLQVERPNGLLGRSATKEEVAILIARMEEQAEIAPQIELTPENWMAQFGKDGEVDTPIGKVKMGETKYLFVKTFIKTDGSRYIHFESVTVQKEGKEVSISSHEAECKVIKKEMQNGKILHLNQGLSFSSERYLTKTPNKEGSDLVPTPGNLKDKDTLLLEEKQAEWGYLTTTLLRRPSATTRRIYTPGRTAVFLPTLRM